MWSNDDSMGIDAWKFGDGLATCPAIVWTSENGGYATAVDGIRCPPEGPSKADVEEKSSAKSQGVLPSDSPQRRWRAPQTCTKKRGPYASEASRQEVSVNLVCDCWRSDDEWFQMYCTIWRVGTVSVFYKHQTPFQCAANSNVPCWGPNLQHVCRSSMILPIITYSQYPVLFLLTMVPSCSLDYFESINLAQNKNAKYVEINMRISRHCFFPTKTQLCTLAP